METFIQRGDFFPVRSFYLPWRLLSNMETFIQHGDFYPVWRLLSSMKTFNQYRHFYAIWRILSTIIREIFETNSSLHVKQCTMVKDKFLFFKSFLLVLTKLSFWRGEWTLGYHSMEFKHFPEQLEILLIPNFNLNEKIGKAVNK